MPSKQLLDKLIGLGAVPRAPGTDAMVAATEKRLAIRFPPGMADFYRLADGTKEATQQWTWNFFALEELACLAEMRSGCEDLRLYGQSEVIPMQSLIKFCDVLIDAPTYAFGADPESPYYGHFFADQGGEGWRVARSFDEFVGVFVAENDEILLNCH